MTEVYITKIEYVAAYDIAHVITNALQIKLVSAQICAEILRESGKGACVRAHVIIIIRSILLVKTTIT